MGYSVTGSGLFDLSGRMALVVGGTSGIGRALALGLADAGADVVATGRREDLVAEVATAIESRGRRSLRMACDVEDASSLERLRARCLDEFGAIDILVAAAGRNKRVPTLEMTDADWDGIIETNLSGVFRTCRVFAAPMVARGYGRVVVLVCRPV
jgi:NAD(P)-dependent dehydrogenase (short-subunit alcohol dehydrogenase family)